MQNLILIPGITAVQLRMIYPVSEEGNEKWFQCAVQSCLFKSCVQRGFLWQVIQKLMAVLLSVSVNQIHCISAIWCVCWPCRALCRCGPSGWNGVRAQAARKTQKLSTRYLANQNLLLCLFNKMEQCVWMEHASWMCWYQRISSKTLCIKKNQLEIDYRH